LEPDIVIVLGYETFYNLPEEGEEGKTYKTKKEMPTWKCQLESKTIHFCGIQHPSSFGFSNEPWQNNFEAFLKDNFNIEYD